MERELRPNVRGDELVYDILGTRFRTITRPDTRLEVTAKLEELTPLDNAALAGKLLDNIMFQRTSAKQKAALVVLEMQLGQTDENGYYPLGKIDTKVLTDLVEGSLDHYQARQKSKRTTELVKEAVVLIEPYIPGDEETYSQFLEKCKTAGVLSESIDTSTEVRFEKARMYRFWDLLKNNSKMTITGAISFLGIGYYAAHAYLDRFEEEGVLPVERKKSSKKRDEEEIAIKRTLAFFDANKDTMSFSDMLRMSGPAYVTFLKYYHILLARRKVPTIDAESLITKESAQAEVLFERNRRGKLALNPTDIDQRKNVVLEYILTTDDPINTVAEKCGISKVAAYRYYKSLVDEGKVPIDKMRKGGQRLSRLAEVIYSTKEHN